MFLAVLYTRLICVWGSGDSPISAPHVAIVILGFQTCGPLSDFYTGSGNLNSGKQTCVTSVSTWWTSLPVWHFDTLVSLSCPGKPWAWAFDPLILTSPIAGITSLHHQTWLCLSVCLSSILVGVKKTDKPQFTILTFFFQSVVKQHETHPHSCAIIDTLFQNFLISQIHHLHFSTRLLSSLSAPGVFLYGSDILGTS